MQTIEVTNTLDHKPYHVPVLLGPSVEGMGLKENGIYLDVTFGGGGHSRKILELLPAGARLIAFDQDADALTNAHKEPFRNHPQFTLIDSNFRYLVLHLQSLGITKVHGILADLGVSSYQFDTAERGFSIRFDGPLDMRMNAVSGISAKEVVNSFEEEKLKTIFRKWGELPNASALAAALVRYRLKQPIETTKQLCQIAVKFAKRGQESKYLAQVFQALRIEVNQELGALEQFLLASLDLLDIGGRLVVLTYHSLEDRMVKNFMRSGRLSGEVLRDIYGNNDCPFGLITRKPIEADEAEIIQNPRARSAKLRIAEKMADFTPKK